MLSKFFGRGNCVDVLFLLILSLSFNIPCFADETDDLIADLERIKQSFNALDQNKRDVLISAELDRQTSYRITEEKLPAIKEKEERLIEASAEKIKIPDLPKINRETSTQKDIPCEVADYQPPVISYSEIMGYKAVHKPIDQPSDSFQETTEPAFVDNENITMKGEIDLSFGIEDSDFIWQRSNRDLWEKNWRVLSFDGFNRGINTFDPMIFDRFKLEIDLHPKESPFRLYSDIRLDPWSFTGKSESTTLQSVWGDIADVEFLYWPNTGYTFPQTVVSGNGDLVNIPEIKVVDGKLLPRTTNGAWGGAFPNTYTIPAVDIDTYFQPFREAILEYKPSDEFKLEIFPLAFESIVETSNDPLSLSNNKIYWENSPWLNSWKPGKYLPSTDSYYKGKWDNAFAFSTYDESLRLTELRGVSFNMNPTDKTSLDAMVATPKTLWQDYDSFDAVPGSIRMKHFLWDDLYIGKIITSHLGYDAYHNLDALNIVNGFDAGKSFVDNTVKIEAEVAVSYSEYNRTNKRFEEELRGNAYYLGLTTTSNPDDNILKKDFYGLKPQQRGTAFTINRFYFGRMDGGFDPSLASYNHTARDEFWSQHLHFRKPFTDFFSGSKTRLSLDDMLPYAIGDGIRPGRYTIGFHSESEIPEYRLKDSISIRNVMTDHNNRLAESVTRIELEHQTTDKLTTKLLGINRQLPQTKAGIDPYVMNGQTGEFIPNSEIRAGEDPSVRTASLGSEYAITEKIKWHGIWEYTNDLTSGSNNFPRGLLIAGWSGLDDTETYMIDQYALYNQFLFDAPPYDYHNVFKTGFEFMPTEQWDFYLDYTFNPNKFAGPVSDAMNHLSLEATYLASEKLGFFAKYTWSRWYDLDDLNQSNPVLDYHSHHNIFTEMRYLLDPTSSLVLEYGVGPSMELSTITFDPYGGSLPTIDTQHLFRVFYKKQF